MVTLIFGVIFLIVGLVLIFAKDESGLGFVAKSGLGIVAIILITIGFMCLHEYGLETNPQAIDVYRGKTTLEITYKDSIPVDSVVVFKTDR